MIIENTKERLRYLTEREAILLRLRENLPKNISVFDKNYLINIINELSRIEELKKPIDEFLTEHNIPEFISNYLIVDLIFSDEKLFKETLNAIRDKKIEQLYQTLTNYIVKPTIKNNIIIMCKRNPELYEEVIRYLKDAKEVDIEELSYLLEEISNDKKKIKEEMYFMRNLENVKHKAIVVKILSSLFHFMQQYIKDDFTYENTKKGLLDLANDIDKKLKYVNPMKLNIDLIIQLDSLIRTKNPIKTIKLFKKIFKKNIKN